MCCVTVFYIYSDRLHILGCILYKQRLLLFTHKAIEIAWLIETVVFTFLIGIVPHRLSADI